VRTPGRHQALLDGQLVVLHAPTGRFVVVAGLAALVCVATDGRTTIAGLTVRIAADLGVDETDLIDEVNAAVAALCHEHVIVLDAAPTASDTTATVAAEGVGLRLHGTLAVRDDRAVWICAGTDPVSTDLLAALRSAGWTCQPTELIHDAADHDAADHDAAYADHDTGRSHPAAAEPVAIVLVERSSAPADEPVLGGAFTALDALVATLPTVTDGSWRDPRALQDLADRCATTPVVPLRHASSAERAAALQAFAEPR
jgi:hypothetical protein